MTDARTDVVARTTVLSGVDALVQLLGLRHELDVRDGLTTATMVSGYPGSPLGTLDLAMERAEALLDGHRVVHRPGLNEELAAATVWGSQMGAALAYDGVDGVAGAWYGKTPGLDRSGDVLKHANAMGSGPNGGVVMFCGDDPSAKSSTLACDSQFTFQDACIPVLYPGNQQEVVDLGIHGFWLSRLSGAWVGMKVVTAVADGIGTVELDAARHPAPSVPVVEVDGQRWHHVPLATIGPHAVPDQELLVVHHRLLAAQAYMRANGLDRVVGAAPGARLGIVCAGKTYYDVVQAFADLGVGLDDLAGVGVRILKLAMTYPLVEETALELAASVDEVLVIEEKRPFVETQLRAVLHEAGSRVRVLGKRDRDGAPLTSPVRELDPAAIRDVLIRALPDLEARRPTRVPLGVPLLELPARPPAFCSGCPHNRSTVAPAGALVGGGVGCHGMMYFEARQSETRRLPPTPMGAEGVPWLGLSPFVSDTHLIQNLGDGTLSHSGTLAIRASVAAGVNITFKILYNDAVAMTGGQEVTGLLDVPSLTRALEAEGVAKVVVCAEDPTHYGRSARWGEAVEVVGRDRLPEVQEALARIPGVTVVVYDQVCAAEARRLRKQGVLDEPPRRVVINEAVCEGCGDCSTKSNCLSVLPVDTDLGEKRRIDDLSCNRDYTCLDGDCPSFLTFTPVDGPVRGWRRSTASVAAPAPPRVRPPLPGGSLPEPTVAPIERDHGIYVTGIGGTGIVTANRMVATAAEAAGFRIGGMDQTGLSQKAGAVVSHLHLIADPSATGSAMVGRADLYLSGDILQAASPAHLEKVEPGTTIAVVDSTITPTAAMLQRDDAPPDAAVLEQVIAERVGSDRVAFVDSKRIADDVFANQQLANVVLLGAAYQLGGLPLPLDQLEAAILAGRSGADNLEAFRWGRWCVHDPAAVDAAIAPVASAAEAAVDPTEPTPAARSRSEGLVRRRRLPADLPADLRDRLVRRTAQVIDHQNRARAERYLDLVLRAVAADGADRDFALTRAVVDSWHKLLTYKDEYEVARLHLAADHARTARDLGIEGPYTVTYHLHPPFLRKLGMHRKLPMGRPYELGFQALARMKRLRGTSLDLFGRHPDRVLERELVEEFEQLVEAALSDPTASYDSRVELARSAQSIKGYAEVKDRNVAAWRQHVADLGFGGGPQGEGR